MDLIAQIRQSVIEYDAATTQTLVKQALDDGVHAEQVLKSGLIAAMSEVGRLFECGEYFVPEMLVAARAMKGGLELLRPALLAANVKPIGTIALGTV